MNGVALGISVSATLIAAVAGNLLIPKAAMDWFRGLRWPRWMVPYQAFVVAGVVYYVLVGTVLYRALDRHDVAAIAWTAVVLVANEAWNAVFFGLRSTLGGFVGIVAFAGLLAALLAAVADDRLSLILMSVYAVWIVYDVAWTFALWRHSSTSMRSP
jgi:tryptophan-rich sensory protein